jgi:hypothetical protein
MQNFRKNVAKSFKERQIIEEFDHAQLKMSQLSSSKE